MIGIATRTARGLTLLVLLTAACSLGPRSALAQRDPPRQQEKTRRPDLPRLIDRLGSPRFAEREAASRAIETLGREALPPLREARQSHDPEVRARASALVDRIERSLLVEPTLVQVDFEDEPLSEAVERLARRSGIPVMLDPNTADLRAGRRVTLVDSDPVPFWEAVRRLGQASHQRFDLLPMPRAGQDATWETAQGVVFSEAGGRLAPTSVHGPFLIKLIRIHRESDLDLDGVEGGQLDEEFLVELQVSAEPRMILGPAGDPKLTEAIDDLDQSLLPASTEEPMPPGLLPVTEYVGGSFLHLNVPLRSAPRDGSVIRHLKGTVQVAIAVRKPEPIIVPLDQASGKAFLGEDIVLTVQKVRRAPDDPHVMIDLKLRTRGDGATLNVPGVDILDSQFEARDARDRVLPVFPQWGEPGEEIPSVTLIVPPAEGAGRPNELRFYTMLRTRITVPFEFQDVPLR